MTSIKRILRDYKDIQDHPYDNDSITVEPRSSSDYTGWQVTIIGQDSTVYENGIFFMNIDFPVDYPFKPPTVKFITKIYHPNIDDKTGGICLALLKDNWQPNVTIRQVINEIITLLYNPDIDNALRADVAQTYKNNIKQYEINAKEWTQKYAQ